MTVNAIVLVSLDDFIVQSLFMDLIESSTFFKLLNSSDAPSERSGTYNPPDFIISTAFPNWSDSSGGIYKLTIAFKMSFPSTTRDLSNSIESVFSGSHSVSTAVNGIFTSFSSVSPASLSTSQVNTRVSSFQYIHP